MPCDPRNRDATETPERSLRVIASSHFGEHRSLEPSEMPRRRGNAKLEAKEAKTSLITRGTFDALRFRPTSADIRMDETIKDDGPGPLASIVNDR